MALEREPNALTSLIRVREFPQKYLEWLFDGFESIFFED